MADIVYNKLKDLESQNTFNWSSSTNVKVMLLTSSYTPNKDHNFISDIVANEVSGTGYTGGFGGAGRKAVGGRTLNKNDSTDKEEFKTTDIAYTWLAVTLTNARYLAFAREITNDSDSPVLFLWDFGSNKNPAAQNLIVTVAASAVVLTKS